MTDRITLPATVKHTEKQTINGELVDVEVTEKTLVEATVVDVPETDKTIHSMDYLPKLYHNKDIAIDATNLLDSLLKGKAQIEEEMLELQNTYGEDKELIPVDWTVIDAIYTAFCDTIYKLPGFTNLSYEARCALLREKGFGYVLDLLFHIYDDQYAELERQYEEGIITIIPTYDDFVKDKSDAALTRLTMLFSIINVLKGTTTGLELVFEILGINSFLYLTWDIVADYRGELLVTDFNKFIPKGKQTNLTTGEEEPAWGTRAVVDNNIIWERTKQISDVEWTPDTSISYGDVITTSEGYYQAVEPVKGMVYELSNTEENAYYIYNGVSWHLCTEYIEYTTPRRQFTAELTINGLSNSPTFQESLVNFVRYYMLPYIEVSLEFTQNAPYVYAYPTGYGILEQSFNLSNYVDNYGHKVHKNLSYQVNDRWGVTYKTEKKDITLGTPMSADKAFQGSLDLSKSFLLDHDNVKQPLFGENMHVWAPEISGTAMDKYTEEDTILNYDGDYIQAPLTTKGRVELDYYIEEQQNPYYEEDVFVRDTLVRIFSALTVGGMAESTIKYLSSLTIGDFKKVIEEVYGGRVTNPIPTSTTLKFNTRPSVTREETGEEGPYNLVFSDYKIEDDVYTGIGDIGILGANNYFIYNGMLMKSIQNDFKYIDGENTWSDVGASHAISEQYYTPAIKNGYLKYIKDDVVYNLRRDNTTQGGYQTYCDMHEITVEMLASFQVNEINALTIGDFKYYADMTHWNQIEEPKDGPGNWTVVTGFVNKYYTAFGICDGRLYKLYLKDDEVKYTMLDEDQGWTYLTGAYYYDTYKAYGIKNGVMYMIDDGITPLTYNDVPLTGWDPSFDCISRYHHTNLNFTTYAICNNKLYSINGTELTLLDNGNNGTWSSVCGYYNDESPRTFGFAIKSGVLYQIKGNTLEVLDDTKYWTDISGCSTTTNTYVLGLAKDNESDESGHIYKIKANSVDLLYAEGGWTDVFGRYTTSTSKTNDCYGYGVKDNKLYLLHRTATTPTVISGNWKLDGQGEPVDLLDYDITEIYFIYNGQVIRGQENIRRLVPTSDSDDPHNYDISVIFETVGFNNHERYDIHVDNTFTQNTYISPESHEDDDAHYMEGISLAHYNGEFNTSTGISNSFFNCPMVIRGTRKINGRGEAYDFVNEQTYLELPMMGYYMVQFDYNGRTYGPYKFEKNEHSVEFITDNNFLYNIPQDEPEINTYIARQLQIWNDNLTRDIDFLLTIRDEFSITVYTTEYNDYIQELGVHFGCMGTSSDLQPIILDEDETGIFYNNTGVYVNDGTNTTKLFDLAQGDNIEPYLKYQKAGGKYELFKSLNGIAYTSTGVSVPEPKYFGGNGTIFGDCIIFLNDSYIIGSLENKRLYEYGYYLSVDTRGTDVVESLTTGENQEDQKVIQINNSNNEKLVELDMNSLYTSMEAECSNPDLEITNHYTLNKLNIGFEEGVHTATLTYSGEYEIDPEQGYESGNIGDYVITRKANNFSDENYLNINPNNIGTLHITTGDNVEEQYLFDSEEDSIVTNKLLLTSDLTGNYIGDNQMRLVPSGLLYEVLTDSVQTVTRTLTYNAEAFEVDTSLISGVDFTNFDDYTALLDFSHTITEDDRYVTFALDLDNGTLLPDGTTDLLPKLCFSTVDNTPRKIASFDKNDIILQDIDDFVLDEDGQEVWWKVNLKREFRGINEDWITEVNPEPEPKDQLKYENGVVWNFSDTTYLTVDDVRDTYGLRIAVIASDDTSQDQGIVSIENVGSLAIRDDEYVWVTTDGTLYKTGFTVMPNEAGIIAFKNVLNESWEPDRYIVETYDYETEQWVSEEIVNYDCMIYQGDHDDINNREKLTEFKLYYSKDGSYWTPLLQDQTVKFSMENAGDIIIGKGHTGIEVLPFNGKFDLPICAVETYNGQLNEFELERFYHVKQTTDFLVSNEENGEYTSLSTWVTYYPVWDYNFGYEFNGILDMYASKLLLNYDLYWLDGKTNVNTIIKRDLDTAGITYTDEDVFDIEEYGIQLNYTPNRWDVITVTYETKDNAYYLQPNTKYYLKLQTDVDTESGKCLLENDGNAAWNNGVVSDFSITDNYNTTLNGEYIVLKFKPSNITTLQGVCGYNVDNSKGIVIQDKKLYYFDDTNYNDLGLTLKTNKNYWIKLYKQTNKIEYSTDGTNWIITDVLAGFSNYAPFVIGNSYTDQGRVEFLGRIDLGGSYIKEDTVKYLYKPFNRVTPLISTDNVNFTKLGVIPLLTTEEYITFGKGFDGELDLYESNLLLTNNVRWVGNEITIYETNSTETLADDEWRNRFILDDITVDPSKYWTSEERVDIIPQDLGITVTGLPEIGDTITLTYNTWYMFREENTEYEFKVTFDNDYAYISYNKLGEDGYLIYSTEKDNLIINTGYQFNGFLKFYDSRRNGRRFCDWYSWDTYEINYKKHNEEDNWKTWSLFTVDQRTKLQVQCGFDLNGIHYLNTSYLKIDKYITPFMAHYNSKYILPHGYVVIDSNGITTNFDEFSYLQLLPQAFIDGKRVEIFFELGNDISNQGISTNALIYNRYIRATARMTPGKMYRPITVGEMIQEFIGHLSSMTLYDFANYKEVEDDPRKQNNTYVEAERNTKYVVQYFFDELEDDILKTRVLRHNYDDSDILLGDYHRIVAIPVNINAVETDENYYLRSPLDVAKVHAYYRVKNPTVVDWDIYKQSGSATWYPIDLKYYSSFNFHGTWLYNLYVVEVPVGYVNGTNMNPDGLTYRRGDKVQIRICSENFEKYIDVVPYNDIIYKQKASF